MNIFEDVVASAGKGVSNLQEAFKIERDPAVRVYNKMTPKDFQAMTQKYGVDNTAQYIQTMEGRRMRKVT